MSRTPDERNSLVERINRLEFREYARVGWLKAATFQGLHSAAETGYKPAVERYLRGDSVDDDLRREMIFIFLYDWVMYQTPESMGGWGSEDDFVRRDRREALRQIDQIIETTLQDPAALIGKRLNWLDPDDANDDGEVPYAQLRAWFANELFDPDSAAYFVYTFTPASGVPDCPRVIGMDRRVIAMFWLE